MPGFLLSLTLSDWVDIAGVLGFALSLWLACLGWLQKRERFEIQVLDYADFGDSTRFYLSIQNNSAQPLIIQNIKYHETSCELLPKKIRGEPGTWSAVMTRRFPIRVRPHDAEAVFLEFLVYGQNPLIADTWVSFQIQTTSRSGVKTALLGSKSHYLNKMR